MPTEPDLLAAYAAQTAATQAQTAAIEAQTTAIQSQTTEISAKLEQLNTTLEALDVGTDENAVALVAALREMLSVVRDPTSQAERVNVIEAINGIGAMMEFWRRGALVLGTGSIKNVEDLRTKIQDIAQATGLKAYEQITVNLVDRKESDEIDPQP